MHDLGILGIVGFSVGKPNDGSTYAARWYCPLDELQ
jgi:hypothetical protein